MITNEQISRCRVAGTAILTLCLIFTQVGIAATGQVNYNTVYQQLEGFGGAGCYDTPSLPSHSERETVYDLLFDELGIDVYRVRNTYGYDSSNITASKTIIAAAKLRNPDLKIQASAWSPEASLKSGGSTTGGTLAGGPSNYVYDDYAQWWYDSIVEWASDGNGVQFEYISIQNEPGIVTGYDSCKFRPTEDPCYAGYDQAFEAVYNKLNAEMGSSMPKMLAPETMGITGGSEGGAAAYIDALDAIGQIDHVYGFAHHLYSDGSGSYYNPDDKIPAMETFAADYGDYYNKPLLQTEYADQMGWTDAMCTARHINNTLVYEGVTSYYYWSIFRYGANAGGVVTLTSSTTYLIRPTFYAVKHYAYFTDPGWYVVDSSTDDSTNLRISAFKNPSNDELVIVIINISSTTSIDLSLTLNGFSPGESEMHQTTSSAYWSDIGDFNPSSPVPLPAESITTIALMAPIGPQQTLNVSSTSGGSVTTPGEGDFQYPQDFNATIIATPDSYYHFVNWTGTAVDEGKVADPDANSTTVLMDANYTVVANFEADPPDLTPPEPNIMTWASVPAAVGSSAITMTATTATDDSEPVEYYFECINDGDANSEWQEDETYIATGLNPLTSYTFRVKARDSYLTPNETDWSIEESATTYPPSGGDVEIIGSWEEDLSHTKESGDNRALIFIAHVEDDDGDPNLSSVTYGGQPMAKIIDKVVESGENFRAYVVAYILDESGISFATGDAFAPNWAESPDVVAYSSVFLQNVDQTALIGASASNSTTSSDTLTTASLSTEDGDMVLVAATCGNEGSYTVNNDFDEALEHDMSSSTGVDGYKFATGVDETPSVTHSNANRQVIIGFVVQAGGEWLYGDFTGDDIVDMNDMPGFCGFWLMDDCSDTNAIDLNEDCIINFHEFSVIGGNWLK
jgi:glucuronoarabinoxylan endo-1,4-beta-xylanase